MPLRTSLYRLAAALTISKACSSSDDPQGTRMPRTQFRIWHLMTIVAITALIAAGLAHDPQSRLALFLHLWLIHALIALVLAAPILFFGRRRANWQWWELFAVIIPFSSWAGFMLSGLSAGKSMANYGECIYLSLAVPVAALLRVGVGGTSHRRAYSAFLIALLCVTAVAVFFLTPSLPE
jgi:hypothetical protein